MHADAIPDADPTQLQRPAAVAARIVGMIEDGEHAQSGARLVAPAWRIEEVAR
jgi:hypothetical protein